MNRTEQTISDYQYRIDVMAAFLAGKTVERSPSKLCDYTLKVWEIDKCPVWDWDSFSYHVREQPAECWGVVNIYGIFEVAEDGLAAEARAEAMNQACPETAYRVVHMKESRNDHETLCKTRGDDPSSTCWACSHWGDESH